MNIHRETFEEILQMNTRDEQSKKRLHETSFVVTFRNFGEIFHHSNMTDEMLSKDAQERQRYAEQVAAKYGCKVSHCAVYCTKGRFDDLWKVRKELIKTMYVSPVFWTPIGEYGYSKFYHTTAFAFGFFPYCERASFVFNKDIDIPTVRPFKLNIPGHEPVVFDHGEYKVTTRGLHNTISRRIRLLNETETHPDVISLRHIISDDPSSELCFVLAEGDFRYVEPADDSKYLADMSAEDYFHQVVCDYDMTDFIIPEYKMLLVGIDDDDEYDKTYIRLYDLWRMLSRRIALSNILTLEYDERDYYYFHYDDTRVDNIYQHIGFFDTWYYNPNPD